MQSPRVASSQFAGKGSKSVQRESAITQNIFAIFFRRIADSRAMVQLQIYPSGRPFPTFYSVYHTQYFFVFIFLNTSASLTVSKCFTKCTELAKKYLSESLQVIEVYHNQYKLSSLCQHVINMYLTYVYYAACKAPKLRQIDFYVLLDT